jgi:hypothetical protein
MTFWMGTQTMSSYMAAFFGIGYATAPSETQIIEFQRAKMFWSARDGYAAEWA